MEDLGVTVLAPEKGWLYIPSRHLLKTSGFRSLPNEVGKTKKQIEDEFLDCIRKSDFLYVVNENGYIGSTVMMEIGFAIGSGIPIYTSNPIEENSEIQSDLWFKEILKVIKVMSAENAIKDFTSKIFFSSKPRQL